MAVGFAQNQSAVNERAGSLALLLRNTLRDCQTFYNWVNKKTDAELLGLGYAQADVDALRAAALDMRNIARVYAGQVPVATAYDFSANPGNLTGTL